MRLRRGKRERQAGSRHRRALYALPETPLGEWEKLGHRKAMRRLRWHIPLYKELNVIGPAVADVESRVKDKRAKVSPAARGGAIPLDPQPKRRPGLDEALSRMGSTRLGRD